MSGTTYILGIHDGHNSSAALIADGAVVGAISEERLTRRKNQVGYPRLAVEAVLSQAGVEAAQLERIALASLFMHAPEYLTDISPWYRVGLDKQRLDKASGKDYNRVVFDRRRQARLGQIEAHLRLEPDRVQVVEHHLAHAAAAYFGAPWDLTEPTLIFTSDGAGDGLCGTVSVGRDGRIERLEEVDRALSLGKVYSRVTYLMGLKPWEHEYKLMGLAPYAGPGRAKSRRVFEDLMDFDAERGRFRLKTELEMNYIYFHLRDCLENVRFDDIAGGLQDYTEQMLEAWVRAHVQRTGLGRIACGGGVFMNVKANARLAALPQVEAMFACPGCGDESLAIGAAYCAFNETRPGAACQALTTLYLGPEYDNQAVARALEKTGVAESCRVERREDIDEYVGRLVAENHIVARLAGRMEWGARALGNRSILANGADSRNVDRINRMIKQRDFWMPFAPTITAEWAERYLQNPTGADGSFMMYAYQSTDLAVDDLAATMHPYDRTLRAQVLTEADNSRYHRLLQSYEQQTGRGGLLNTSFNLHGHPIVCSPEDALQVFAKSGLRNLALENHFITKD
ncbi:MAG: hypothetical protein KJ621_12525 [Proteobacteria bacterium]|nr:hypothetical protein [Pseudomonadota bacterium]